MTKSNKKTHVLLAFIIWMVSGGFMQSLMDAGNANWALVQIFNWIAGFYLVIQIVKKIIIWIKGL